MRSGQRGQAFDVVDQTTDNRGIIEDCKDNEIKGRGHVGISFAAQLDVCNGSTETNHRELLPILAGQFSGDKIIQRIKEGIRSNSCLCPRYSSSLAASVEAVETLPFAALFLECVYRGRYRWLDAKAGSVAAPFDYHLKERYERKLVNFHCKWIFAERRAASPISRRIASERVREIARGRYRGHEKGQGNVVAPGVASRARSLSSIFHFHD